MVLVATGPGALPSSNTAIGGEVVPWLILVEDAVAAGVVVVAGHLATCGLEKRLAANFELRILQKVTSLRRAKLPTHFLKVIAFRRHCGMCGF
jgi:hypothetical protein